MSHTPRKARYLLVLLEDIQLALPLALIERVERMPAFSPLPGAPRDVTGMINLAGEAVPVADPRRRLGLAPRPQRLDDRLVLVRTDRRRMALWVDETGEVFESGEQLRSADELWPGLVGVRGVASLGRDLVVLYDLEGFFSPEEEERLDQALTASETGIDA